MYLEGDALDLFSWVNNERTVLYWEELVRALQEHYGLPEYRNPDEYLCVIRQTGSVSDYRSEFTRRSSRVKNWLEHCLLGVFLNGLREDLRADVRIHKPRTVYRASSLALEYEAKSNTVVGSKSHLLSRTANPNRESRSVGSSWGSNRSTTSSSATVRPFLSTSSAEYQQRREKGLCFRCAEPFKPGHRCSGSLALFEVTEEDEEEEVTTPLPKGSEENAEISLHAILGKLSASTMKLRGLIKNKEIMILVDSGSTHNFISEKLVAELQLPVQTIQAFGVQIGDGRRVTCNLICPKLEVQVSNLIIKQEFFPFSLGGVDLVLGIK